jgi:hypothetical protein
MTTIRVLGALALAAAIGAGVDQLVEARIRATLAPEGFQIQDVKWNRTETAPIGDYAGSVSHEGTAQVIGTGEAATGHYVVLVAFIRSKRVNPADAPDTLWATTLTTQGVGRVSGEDHAYGCTKFTLPATCARSMQDFEGRFEIVGWVRLAEPPQDSGRSR